MARDGAAAGFVILGRILAAVRIRISKGAAAGAALTYCRSRWRSSRSVLWNVFPQPGQSHCRVDSLWFCWCLLGRQSASRQPQAATRVGH